MAIDVYMKIDGIDGESSDKDHQKWIECSSVAFGVIQPKSATASTAGGLTAERCEHQDLVITKLVDLASPLMLKFSSTGMTFKKVALEFMRANADGKRVKYFTVSMENVIISSVNAGLAAGEVLHETVALRYAKVKWEYQQLKVDGTVAGTKQAGYDLSTNTAT